jgi:hypothetical protein
MVGSIHDDAVAQDLGFRNGLVSSTVLVELFPPLILEFFGERWFEQGSISFYFPIPIVEGDEVRAVMGLPPKSANDVQVEAWVERRDGQRIADGTIAVGNPPELSALRARKLDRYDHGEPYLLAGVKAGDQIPWIDVALIKEEADFRASTVTELLGWLQRDWPWGAPPVIMRNMIQTMVIPAMTHLKRQREEGIPIYGAVEIRNVHGPMKVEHPYRGGGTILYVGTSPKTEYLWYDSDLQEKDGTTVAQLRMMLRFMKLPA